MSEPERLQKLLARAGYGSRREIERWIEDGQVTVNGRVAGLGDQARPEDQITVRGQPISLARVEHFKPRVIAYHKPLGEICTERDPEGRPTVFDQLPRMKTSRWISVGRLDVNTLGLLLLTNDGELANRLMHPSYGIAREYMVRVLGEVNEAMLERLRAGVELEDGPAHFDEVTAEGGSGANRWFRVRLAEGRKREVRRLWESQGVTVSRLIRVSYGPIKLERGLHIGNWRELSPKEMEALYAAVRLHAPAAGTRRPAGAKPSKGGQAAGRAAKERKTASAKPGAVAQRHGEARTRPGAHGKVAGGPGGRRRRGA